MRKYIDQSKLVDQSQTWKDQDLDFPYQWVPIQELGPHQAYKKINMWGCEMIYKKESKRKEVDVYFFELFSYLCFCCCCCCCEILNSFLLHDLLYTNIMYKYTIYYLCLYPLFLSFYPSNPSRHLLFRVVTQFFVFLYCKLLWRGLKFVVRKFTGRCELQRICYNNKHGARRTLKIGRPRYCLHAA